jgi:hypothetical protein
VARPERLISVDIEADGPIPGEFSMLSLGAVPIDDPTHTFYRELQPISDVFEPDALAVSGLDRERLKVDGATPESAMHDFVAWLDDCGGDRAAVDQSWCAAVDLSRGA